MVTADRQEKVDETALLLLESATRGNHDDIDVAVAPEPAEDARAVQVGAHEIMPGASRSPSMRASICPAVAAGWWRSVSLTRALPTIRTPPAPS